MPGELSWLGDSKARRANPDDAGEPKPGKAGNVGNAGKGGNASRGDPAAAAGTTLARNTVGMKKSKVPCQKKTKNVYVLNKKCMFVKQKCILPGARRRPRRAGSRARRRRRGGRRGRRSTRAAQR